MKFQLKIVSAAVSVTILAGCAGITAKYETDKIVEQVKTGPGSAASQLLAVQKQEAARHQYVEDVKTPFTGNQQVAAPKTSSWPSALRRDAVVTMSFGNNKVDENNHAIIPISELAHQIYLATGIPVQVRPEALKDAAGKVTFVTLPPNYRGNIPDILEQLAGRQRIFAQMSDGRLELFRTATRTFLLSTSLGSTNVAMDASSGGGEGGFTGTSTSTFAGTIDSTKSMVDAIRTMLSPGAPLPIFNNGTGNLTVTDTPDVLDAIARFVDRENKIIKRSIIFDVQIVRYSQSNVGENSADLSVLYSQLKALNGTAIKLVGAAAPPSPNDGSLGFTAVPGLNGATNRFTGSNLVLKALNTSGKATVTDSYTLEAMNRSPAVKAFNKTFDYVNETNASTTLAGVAVAQKTKTESAGKTLMLLPSVISETEASVELSIRESVLNPFKSNSIGSGQTQQSVQLLDKDTELVRQRIRLRNGETRVLTGVGNKSASSNEQTMDRSISSIFGGSATGSKSESQYFLLLTMRFVD